MLKGKGHSIAIPNDMKIAKTLPNLPQEVGIILLRKKDEEGEVLKDYTVKRSKVEGALKVGGVRGGPLTEIPTIFRQNTDIPPIFSQNTVTDNKLY